MTNQEEIWVVIRNMKGYLKNVVMSKKKRLQYNLGCIIKVFKKIIEVLSKMVSNRKRDEKRRNWKK